MTEILKSLGGGGGGGSAQPVYYLASCFSGSLPMVMSVINCKSLSFTCSFFCLYFGQICVVDIINIKSPSLFVLYG